MARTELHITGDPEADSVLSRDPLALLIGMVLDQQVTMEKAFGSPAELARRLGGRLEAGSMAGRVQEVCRAVAEQYGGRADAIWKGVRSGDELLARLKALPGFGEQK